MAGNKDKAKGTWNEAKGKVKSSVGDATDNRSLQAEGLVDQAKGKAQKAVGKVKDKAEDAVDRVD